MSVQIIPPSVMGVQITPPPSIHVTLGATQGLAGPPGASSGSAVYAAFGAVSGHVVVAEVAPGRVAPADPTNLGHVLRVVGVSTNAAVDGAPIVVQSARVLEHSGWTFTPGGVIYVGLTGALVQSAPIGALFSQTIGIALTATTVLLSFQPPIIL